MDKKAIHNAMLGAIGLRGTQGFSVLLIVPIGECEFCVILTDGNGAHYAADIYVGGAPSKQMKRIREVECDSIKCVKGYTLGVACGEAIVSAEKFFTSL